MSSGLPRELYWSLLYTKPRAETWADMNLRKQGFVTLLPLVRLRGSFAPLYPRYIFVGHTTPEPPSSLHGTYGVQYVVQNAGRPARISADVIAEVRSRMNEQGVVRLEKDPKHDALFSPQRRERIRALIKLAEAGFRVREA